MQVGETLLKIVVEENSISPQAADTFKNTGALDSSIGDSDGQSSVPVDTKLGGVLSTPAVRNLAKQYGIDISDIKGTGEGGRVLKEDVLNYTAKTGIIKERFASSSSYEELSQGEEMYPEVSAAYGWEYEDKTVQLRYIIKSAACDLRVPNIFCMFMCCFWMKCDLIRSSSPS